MFLTKYMSHHSITNINFKIYLPHHPYSKELLSSEQLCL